MRCLIIPQHDRFSPQVRDACYLWAGVTDADL
jgi:hypothetical protein